MALIPIVINRFLYGKGAPPFENAILTNPTVWKLHDSQWGKLYQLLFYPQQLNFGKMARTKKYGYLYTALDPKIWAEQQISLTTASTLSNHILAAFHNMDVWYNCEDKFDNVTKSHITPDFDTQNSAVNASCHDASCLCRTPCRKTNGRQTKSNSFVLLPWCSGSVPVCSIVR